MFVVHDGKGKIWGVFCDLDDVRDSLNETYSRVGGVRLVKRDDDDHRYVYLNEMSKTEIIADRVKFFNHAEHL
jgi:hypothetical protein